MAKLSDQSPNPTVADTDALTTVKDITGSPLDYYTTVLQLRTFILSSKSLPTGAFVGTTDTQTLTAKTIDASSNTISNITNAMLSGTAGITAANLATTATDTELNYLSGVTSNIQDQFNSQNYYEYFDEYTSDGSKNISDIAESTLQTKLSLSGLSQSVKYETLSIEFWEKDSVNADTWIYDKVAIFSVEYQTDNSVNHLKSINSISVNSASTDYLVKIRFQVIDAS